MPGWIQRNEDINYLQEGRDKKRAWTTLLTNNITHMVMDDAEIAKCVLGVERTTSLALSLGCVYVI